jgi:hypothetical protein
LDRPQRHWQRCHHQLLRQRIGQWHCHKCGGFGGNNIPAGGTGEALATFHIGASGTSGGVNVTVSTSCGAVSFPIYVIFAN